MFPAKDVDLQLMRLLRRAAHLHLQGEQSQKRYFRGQGRILVLLKNHGTLSQRELALLSERRPATLSEQLDLLEAAGLVIRQKNPQDRRGVDVSLTEQGLADAKQSEINWNEAATAMFSALNSAEKAALCRLLTKLNDGWGERQGENP